jgi:hypothetical protein
MEKEQRFVIDEHEPDETAVDSAMHPDKIKQDGIWINIGSERALAYLCIPIEDSSGNTLFASFNMNSEQEINEVISMLEEAKVLMAGYIKEYWED